MNGGDRGLASTAATDYQQEGRHTPLEPVTTTNRDRSVSEDDWPRQNGKVKRRHEELGKSRVQSISHSATAAYAIVRASAVRKAGRVSFSCSTSSSVTTGIV